MKRAFTLMELLVVVAIVAILAALLFPVFARAREKGRITVCIANLRQIGAAVTSYALDTDDRYPKSLSPFAVASTHQRPALCEVVDRYVRNHGIWECPSDRGDIPYLGMGIPTGGHIPYWDDRRYRSSYDYAFPGGYPVARVKKPSETILSVELLAWHDPGHGKGGRRLAVYCDDHVAWAVR